MSMHNPGLTLNFTATAIIAARTIVTFGAADGQVVGASGVANPLLGVTTEVNAALNERCDVIVKGVAQVIYGAAVTRGQRLTTNASGQAVPSAAGTDRVIGIAMVSGVTNDIGSVLLAQD